MIRFERVEKRYGQTHALREVTLHVPAGVIYGLIGPNGAGKTTALRLVAGLARPTSGTVRIGGDGRAAGAARSAAPTVGYLPQRVELNGLATPRETVRLFACLRNLPAEAADAALDEAGIGVHRDRQVRMLSGGMRQRLGLAIACLGDPGILLLDEASAGLDPLAAVELRREMRRLADLGKTVVVSSHSLPEMESVCDRIALLLDGQVVAEGALEDLTRGRGHRSLDELFREKTRQCAT